MTVPARTAAMASSTVSSPRSRARWLSVPAGTATNGRSRSAAMVATAASVPSPPAAPMATSSSWQSRSSRSSSSVELVDVGARAAPRAARRWAPRSTPAPTTGSRRCARRCRRAPAAPRDRGCAAGSAAARRRAASAGPPAAPRPRRRRPPRRQRSNRARVLVHRSDASRDRRVPRAAVFPTAPAWVPARPALGSTLAALALVHGRDPADGDLAALRRSAPVGIACGSGICSAHGSRSPRCSRAVCTVKSFGVIESRSSQPTGNDTGTPGRTRGL